jgi:hypothetical protein
VDQPAHVPHLQDDLAAFLVHRLGDCFPAFDLLVAPDARCGGPAEAFDADPGRFADDQPGAGALAVIGDHHLVGDRTGLGRAAARERRHDDAVAGLDRAQFQRFEKLVVHKRVSNFTGVLWLGS